MPSEKERIDQINRKIRNKHNEYLKEYNELLTQYSNLKDEYNGSINQINSEKVTMRDELKRLFDFLIFVGGTLDKKISIPYIIRQNFKFLRIFDLCWKIVSSAGCVSLIYRHRREICAFLQDAK